VIHLCRGWLPSELLTSIGVNDPLDASFAFIAFESYKYAGVPVSCILDYEFVDYVLWPCHVILCKLTQTGIIAGLGTRLLDVVFIFLVMVWGIPRIIFIIGEKAIVGRVPRVE